MNSSAEYEAINSSKAAPKALGAPSEIEPIREKLIRYARTVTHFARLLFGLMLDNRVDKKVKIFAGAVLAYILAPVDFIPEIFSGLFGMLDDFVLSAFALNVLLNWVDPAIVRSHWRGENDLLETVQKGMKNAEILVPEAIVKKIQLWIGRHVEKAIVPVEPKPKAKPRRKKTDTVQ
jgi:uncharacterized membrane protein YkvA (DUF1232 family)